MMMWPLFISKENQKIKAHEFPCINVQHLSKTGNKQAIPYYTMQSFHLMYAPFLGKAVLCPTIHIRLLSTVGQHCGRQAKVYNLYYMLNKMHAGFMNKDYWG